MFLLHCFCLLLLLLDYSKGDVIKNTNTVPNRKLNNFPSVNSRFFDLSGILGQLFPGFNLGTQGGSTGNPNEIGFPSNSQVYPGGVGGGATQVTDKPNPPGPNGYEPGMGSRPIIDDASQYPYHGQNPGNNFGVGMSTQNPNYNQFPNQVNGGGYPQTQYPGQNIWQYPQGQNPQQNQYPDFWPGSGGQGPQFNQYPSFPANSGNFGQGLPQNQYPGHNPQQNPYPGTSGNPGNIGNPGQGYPSNQNGQICGPGTGNDNDGTLDAIVPPEPSFPVQNYPEPGVFENNNPGVNEESNGAGTSAILGQPVLVPTDKTTEESIVFPQSTESPLQKQCVQDCQTTSEYSPVCGTDNVTYFNPGRFICARNCGINVFVRKQGKCDADGI